ncbi:MAG: type IV secretion system DNA-binding domain-containing protein [Lachnospiraceae bacterium]|nr:type IV secretion system DNA-binding domain-containing protein [Lachnospiraceae bacterium]
MYGQIVKRVISGIDLSEAMPPACTGAAISIPGTGAHGPASLQLSVDQCQQGVALLGATGSGKTYLGRKMITDLRRSVQEPYSMIVIQAKDDCDDLIRPGDLILEQGTRSDRSVRWNLFKDLLADGYDPETVKRNTREFVRHIFDYKKDSKEPFFVDGASELLYCIIIAYIQRGIHSLQERAGWSNKGLRDFFLSYDPAAYEQVLESCGEPGVLNRILGTDTDNRQALGVWGELVTTVLQILVDIFADEGDFSIREFVKEKSGRALFLNYDPSYREIQRHIYGSLVDLALKEVLARDAATGKTILYCDELPAMGRTDLAGAVNLGRAKGLITICGFQSIDQIYAIYGEHDGRAMLAGLCTKIYFRPNDPTTAQYLQSDFGTVLADYMTLSPGGCTCVRREGHAVEDPDILNMQRGECFVKDRNGSMYRFRIA